MTEHRVAEEQKDVLPKKGNVTQTNRGLQQWGEEGVPDEQTSGTASTGTAERAARITRGQLEKKDG